VKYEVIIYWSEEKAIDDYLDPWSMTLPGG
jgi:hypothetical protein